MVGTCTAIAVRREGTHCSQLTGHGVNIRAERVLGKESQAETLTRAGEHTHATVSEPETHKQIPEMKQKPGNKAPVRSERSAAVARIPNNNNRGSQQVN